MRGLALTLVGLGLGCSTDLGADAITQCDREISIPIAPTTDVLFVIDDSHSMREEQENLATNFNQFVTALAGAGLQREFQIGVTTTSVMLRYFAGASGDVVEVEKYADDTSYCQDPQNLAGKPFAKGNLISAIGRPAVLRFDSPTIVADFQAAVKVGTCGSGQEQGLEAMRLAIRKAMSGAGPNAGFLRAGARLAVVMVMDEDDCSDPDRRVALGLDASTDWCFGQSANLGKIEDYVAFLYGLGKEVFFAAIAPVNDQGVPERCGTAFGVGRRLVQVAAAFGGNGLVKSICSADFGPALTAIAGLLEAPSTFPIPEPPADPRLLEVNLIHADGSQVDCALGAALTYTPPQSGAPATLTVSGACKPKGGDRLDVHVLCAG